VQILPGAPRERRGAQSDRHAPATPEGYDLVAVGRRRDRLDELVAALPDIEVRRVVADLGTDAGVERVADLCATEPVTMLVNNAGVAHYMPFVERRSSRSAARSTPPRSRTLSRSRRCSTRS
jgi:NAD(P)-dependent dehydrogenase (short-subunit alcohol dehydrogenase family)